MKVKISWFYRIFAEKWLNFMHFPLEHGIGAHKMVCLCMYTRRIQLEKHTTTNFTTIAEQRVLSDATSTFEWVESALHLEILLLWKIWSPASLKVWLPQNQSQIRKISATNWIGKVLSSNVSSHTLAQPNKYCFEKCEIRAKKMYEQITL